MLHSGRFGNNSSSSRNGECGGPGKHPAPLSPPFPPPLQDHACVRDEAVHRDTRPELRPTSHKSRSLTDCKICEHIATIKSASLVRGYPLCAVCIGNTCARVCVRACQCVCVSVHVRACVCACVLAAGGWFGGGGEDEEEVRRGGKGCLCSQLYICSHGNRILLMDVIFSILSSPLCLCFYVCALHFVRTPYKSAPMSVTNEI